MQQWGINFVLQTQFSSLNQGRIMQQNERDGLHFSSAVPKMQWPLTPTAPKAIMLMGTFTFTCL